MVAPCDIPISYRSFSSNSVSNRNSNVDSSFYHTSTLGMTFTVSLSRSQLGLTGFGTSTSNYSKQVIPTQRKPTRKRFTPFYLHIEYYHGFNESILQTDLVLFSPCLAKVYPLGSLPILVTPWVDDESLWIAWSEAVRLECTDETILHLWNSSNSGGLQVRYWDGREKCAPQARFDRPKSVASSVDINEIAIQKLVETMPSHPKQTQKFIVSRVAGLTGRDSQNISNGSAPRTSCSNTAQTNGIHQPDRTTSPESVQSIENPNHEEQLVYQTPSDHQPAPILPECREPSRHCNQRVSGRTRSTRTRKSDQTNPSEPNADNLGICCLVLNVAYLFRRQAPVHLFARKPHSLTVSIELPLRESVMLAENPTILDFMVKLEVSDPLLSDAQREHFKPMIIETRCLRNLPAAACASYAKMRHMCEPVRLKWNFGEVMSYTSTKYLQQKDVPMTDIQVVLTGLHPPEQITEMMLSTPLTFDLYDRIPRKTMGKQKSVTESAGALFGAEPEDSDLATIKPTLEVMPDRARTAIPSDSFTPDEHPFGRVTVHLDEMLNLRLVLLERDYPVLPIDETAFDLQTTLRTATENPRTASRQYVGYVDADCSLSIRVELNYDLQAPPIAMATPIATDGTLERFICIVENPATKCIDDMKLLVLQHNARCMNIQDDRAIETLQMYLGLKRSKRPFCLNAFSGYESLTEGGEESRSSAENLITGFHLSDPTFHILVLELPSEENAMHLFTFGIQSLLSTSADHLNIKFIRNSGVRFTGRLYWSQHWGFPEIHVLVPISRLIQQPLFHVRDLLPRLAYCAVTKLHTLRTMYRSLKDVTRANLLPTSMMLDALIREFSAPPLLKEHLSRVSSASRKLQESQSQLPSLLRSPTTELVQSAVTRPAQTRGPWVSCVGRKGTKTSAARKTSTGMQPTLYRATSCAKHGVYNYSVQRLNSAVIARKELSDKLSQTNRTYTYSNRFLHSAGFEPNPCVRDFRQILREYNDSGCSKLGSVDNPMQRKIRWNFSSPIYNSVEEKVGYRARFAKAVTSLDEDGRIVK
ncbi:unnamed protein product [Dicrocoelium dendriticum]|nr:unnamed protein product [Dicrocoelium dendriticum]